MAVQLEDWNELKQWLKEWKYHLEKGDKMFLGGEETARCVGETLTEMNAIEIRRRAKGENK